MDAGIIIRKTISLLSNHATESHEYGMSSKTLTRGTISLEEAVKEIEASDR